MILFLALVVYSAVVLTFALPYPIMIRKLVGVILHMMHVDLFLLFTNIDFPSHGFMERTFRSS